MTSLTGTSRKLLPAALFVLVLGGFLSIHSQTLAQTQSSQIDPPTKVTFDAENTLYVNGEALFPVFTWHGGTPEVSLMGENITRRLLTSDPHYWQRMSPIPYSFIRVSTLEKDWRSQLKANVPFVKNQPSTFIYFLTHEPSFAGEPPEQVNEMARMLQELDPDHPSFVHIGGDNPIRAKTYSQDSRILSISSMGISPGLTAVKTARAQIVTNGQTSIWPCLHLFMPDVTSYSTDDAARVDPWTFRAALYAALVSGAKGISFYAPDHYAEWYNEVRPKSPRKMDHLIIETHDSIPRLTAELRYLTPIIAAPTCKQQQVVTGDDGRLITLLKAVGGELFLFAVNYTTDGFDATFNVSSLTGGAEFEIRAPLEGEAKWFGRSVKERSTEGVFSDHFGPFGVHVYQITSRADMNAMRPGDAHFDVPPETEAERMARFQGLVDRVLPHVTFSPIGDRDPMYWDEAGGVRRLRLDAAEYARPLRLSPASAGPSVTTNPAGAPNTYSDATRFYLLPSAGASVTIEVTDVKNDAATPPAVLLLTPDGKEIKRYGSTGGRRQPIRLSFQAPAMPAEKAYTLIVKSLGHHVKISGCASVIDAGTVLTYTGDGTTFYFHVPAGVSRFSVTSMVAKGPKKGIGEGNMIEVIDPAGNVVGRSTAHYLERMLPLEQGGGEREDWQPAINDPGPAKVIVNRSTADARQEAIYAVRLGPSTTDRNLSYVPTFFLRIDAPLSGMAAERPEHVMKVVEKP